MPIPGLMAALPYLGTAAAGFLGSKLAQSRPNQIQSQGRPGQNMISGGNFFTGTPGQGLTFDKFTPEQQQALSKILQGGLSGLGSLGNYNNMDYSFSPIEDKARRDFNQTTIPSIAERFTSIGGQRSSAFPQILGQAGSDLETNLASLKSNYNLQHAGLMQNAQSNKERTLLSLLGLGLQPQFESVYSPRQPGFLENAGSTLLGSLPLLGAAYLMR